MDNKSDLNYDNTSKPDGYTEPAIMLDLSLSGPKSANLFISDQTPTPTRLIRNCEEVGLFEDLRNVNPFEETFRRAVEQKGQVLSAAEISKEAEDSLHTPKVLTRLETAEGLISTPLEDPISSAVTLDVPIVEDILSDFNSFSDKLSTARQNSSSSSGSGTTQDYGKIRRYRSILEKSASNSEITPSPVTHTDSQQTIQIIQPQVITLSFPKDPREEETTSRPNTQTAIPIQTVKPFILPKPTLAAKPQSGLPCPNGDCSSEPPSSSPSSIQHEPSSASLTPTSQLPIKERLKAYINHNNKLRDNASPKMSAPLPNLKLKCKEGKSSSKSDTNERRRAASSRYRNKIRNEHKELCKRNIELQSENGKLQDRIHQLEQELKVLKNRLLLSQTQAVGGNGAAQLMAVPSQVQIPASTLHLIMNIPTVMVPSTGAPVLQQPITYSVEKK